MSLEQTAHRPKRSVLDGVKRGFLSLMRGSGTAQGKSVADSADTLTSSQSFTKDSADTRFGHPLLISSAPARSSSIVAPPQSLSSKQSSTESVFNNIIARKTQSRKPSTGAATANDSVETRIGAAHLPPLDPDDIPEEEDPTLALRYRDTMARVRTRSGGSTAPKKAPKPKPRDCGSDRRHRDPPTSPEQPGMERILLPAFTLYRPLDPSARGPAGARASAYGGPLPADDHLALHPVHFSTRSELKEYHPSEPPSPELFRLLEKRDITRRFKQLVGYKGDGTLEEISEWALLNSMKRSEKRKKKGDGQAKEDRRMWMSGVGDLFTWAVYR